MLVYRVTRTYLRSMRLPWFDKFVAFIIIVVITSASRDCLVDNVVVMLEAADAAAAARDKSRSIHMLTVGYCYLAVTSFQQGQGVSGLFLVRLSVCPCDVFCKNIDISNRILLKLQSLTSRIRTGNPSVVNANR